MFGNESQEVVIGAETKRVTGIVSGEEDTLLCIVEGQSEPVAIPRQAVVDACFVTEADSILSQFPEGSPERTALELQVQALKSNAAAFANPELVDRTITEAAENIGMLTSKGIESFIQTQVATNAVTSEQQTAALEVLKDKNRYKCIH